MEQGPKTLLGLLLVLLAVNAIQAQPDCIQQPQTAGCENYIFPNSTRIVTSFCDMMSNMPGCTIYSTCQNPTYNASTNGNGVCSMYSLAADLCFDMPSMDGPACGNLNSMCHPSTGTSVVRECQTPTLISTLPTYMQTKSAINGLCSSSPPSQSLCDQCIPSNFRCDMLTVYTSLCALNTSRVECARANAFCNSVNMYNWPVCSAMPVDCPRMPQNPTCADYRIANPGAVLNEMCDMMSNMPACSVKTHVCAEKKFSSSPYCTESSLMADVCTDMTMGVQGCVDYVDMCAAGSVVKECSEPSLKTVMPTYSEAKSLVNGICTSMSMSDCSKCSGPAGASCDYLDVYSSLCMAMPGMSQCAAWSKFCKAVPEWPYCSNQASGIPEMRMYFHTGFLDYVLFHGWVPRNGVQYAFTWIAIAIAGILLEAIKFVRAKLEKRWLEQGRHIFAINDESERSSDALPWSIKVDLPRAILSTLELGWGYLLMLVAMTFNVGLFFAVLFGCFAGTLIFGRFLITLPKAKSVSCH